MFPIPFNFPFRKKDGSIVSISKAIEDGGSYTLPTASADTKGGVKVGTGLTMDGETLKNSNPTPYTLPTASAETKGGVKVGDGLNIDENGVLSTSGGGGAGLNYVDITTSITVTGQHFVAQPFTAPAALVGHRVVTGVVLDGTGAFANTYLIGLSRMKDPVTTDSSVYALYYDDGADQSTGIVTKIRVFYI